MAQRRKPGGAAAKERRVTKKKTSILTSENIEWVDYKDVNLLRRFMSERAKIRARRVTGNDQQQQAAVARAIKVAREMALLPYSVRQVTQRSKGRRDRGDRDGRGPDLAAVTEAEAAETEAELEDAQTDFEGDGEGAIDAIEAVDELEAAGAADEEA